MRIGSGTVAVVAITLIAGARLAQAGQLAQAAEPSALAEQFGQENPPAAPAPPAAKPFNPSSDTPAVVIDDREVSAILSKSVRSNAGEDMGRIVDIIVSHDGQVRAAIIDFGGFLGIGTRKIAVDWVRSISHQQISPVQSPWNSPVISCSSRRSTNAASQ